MNILFRTIIILFLFTTSLAACGGGNGVSNGGCSTGIEIRGIDLGPEGVESPGFCDYDDGYGLYGPTYQSGIRRIEGHASHAHTFSGLAITWENSATGKSGIGGIATRTVNTNLIFGSGVETTWNLPFIDLAIGNNPIVITISHSDGVYASTVLTVKRRADLEAPSVTHSSPSPDETNVPINTDIKLTFSELVKYESEAVNSIKLIDEFGTIVDGWASNNSNVKTWIFSPAADLEYSTTYTISIAYDVTDLYGGNKLEGATSWSFTTIRHPDMAPPKVIWNVPESNNQCVKSEASVIARFDEAIDTSTINQSTFLLEDSSGIAISGSITYDAFGYRLTPDTTLEPGITFTVTLGSGIKDLAGNPLEEFNWSFTTDNRETIGNWSEVTNIDAPYSGYSYSAVWTGEEVILWSGQVGGGRYDPNTNQWTSINRQAEYADSDQSAIWTGSEMIVFGGVVWGAETNTRAPGGRYDPLNDTWSPVSSIDVPTKRTEHAALWTGSEMIIWGGIKRNTWGRAIPINTGGRYNPTSDSWEAMSVVGAPSPRIHAQAVWTGTELIVWGGTDDYYNGSDFNDGARYNPLTDSWSPLPNINAPESSQHSSAVWTGNEMLIWIDGLGSGYGNLTHTLRSYNPVSDSWKPLSALCSPVYALSFADGWTSSDAHWDGSRMFIWSNYSTGGYFYEPETDKWQAVATIGQPYFYRFYNLVWAEDKFIILGSDSSSSPTSYGAIFRE